MKNLVRPTQGRIIGGVAAGIANYFHINVGIIRVIWVLLLIPGGLPGFIPYVLFWIFIPSEQKPYIASQE